MNVLQIKQNDKMHYDELSEKSKMADRIWKKNIDYKYAYILFNAKKYQ